jgi:hypothetical protein
MSFNYTQTSIGTHYSHVVPFKRSSPDNVLGWLTLLILLPVAQQTGTRIVCMTSTALHPYSSQASRKISQAIHAAANLSHQDHLTSAMILRTIWDTVLVGNSAKRGSIRLLLLATTHYCQLGSRPPAGEKHGQMGAEAAGVGL